MIRQIEHFRRNGEDFIPNGPAFLKGNVYREIQQNENSFISEAVHGEQYGLERYKGGMIVFSTDINTVIDSSKDGVLTRLKKIVTARCASLMQAILKNRKILELVRHWNRDYGSVEDFFIGALSIGNFFKGRYVSGDSVYDERSTTIEICGCPSALLMLFAAKICEDFKQESVLVKDYNTGHIYLVDANGFNQNTIDEVLKAVELELTKVERLNGVSEALNYLLKLVGC